MLIKDLIKQLQDLYDKRIVDVEVMGEPTIEIDVFEEIEGEPHKFQYKGVMVMHDIKFTMTEDGVYDVLSAFAADYPKENNGNDS